MEDDAEGYRQNGDEKRDDLGWREPDPDLLDGGGE
jgi:hypothetical protein